jgi:hypothetical protein
MLTAAVLAAGAAAGPPVRGVLVPSRSLGGLRLGLTEAQVRAAWGSRYGVCRTCAEPTWYFNATPFRPAGAAVSFRRHRVDALYTLWAPSSWQTSKGLRIGEPATRITEVYGPLRSVPCGDYSALTLAGGEVTSFYVLDDKLWGFGLSRAGAPVCR